MKVGNLVNGLEVIDVKRVNKMNIIQFTKAVSEYIDQGYKLDVNSARQIGLVLQVDCYKLEDNKKDVEVKVTVGKTALVEEKYDQKDLAVKVNGEVIETDNSEVPVKKPLTSRAKKTT